MNLIQVPVIFVSAAFAASFATGYSEIEPFTTRLVGGLNEFEGRVEIFHEGSWATVCDYSMSIQVAHVLCRMAGYASAISHHCCAEFGRGVGDTVFSEISCNGHELNITDCTYEFGKHDSVYSSSLYNCDHSEDVGVTCNPAEVRVKGGSNSLTMRDGRVEILYDHIWTAICAESMTFNFAVVLCRMSGYHTAKGYYDLEWSSIGDGDILNGTFQCRGDEDHFNDCVLVSGRSRNCSDQRMAGVTCISIPVRLVSSKADEGRVEITNDNSEWSAVCFSGWGIRAANVTCRMLGYVGALAAFRDQELFEKTSSVDDVLLDVICSGTESNLAHCNMSNIHPASCENTGYAAARCQGKRSVAMRLSGGADPSKGRVEMFYYGSWGTVCEPAASIAGAGAVVMSNAEVICRMLGFPGALDYKCCNYFGPGVGGIYLYNPLCRGKESNLLDCNSAINGLFPRCNHYNDLGVICQENYDLAVRLVGGESPREGRVEVLYQDAWGTICDDNWDLNDANVVCRMLGYERAESYSCCSAYGEGSGDILFDDIECDGSEVNIGHCPRNELRSHDCSHSEDVGVKCIDLEAEFTTAISSTRGPADISWNLSAGKTVVLVITQAIVNMIALIIIACLYCRLRIYRNNATKMDITEIPLTAQQRGNSSGPHSDQTK